jgi:hypothetical protein
MLTVKRLKWQYFGLKEDQAPLILIQDGDSKKFLKDQIEADQIVSWLKEYFVSTVWTLIHSCDYLFCLINIWYDMIVELIDPLYLVGIGWQIDAVQEVWAYSWGQQWAC